MFKEKWTQGVGRHALQNELVVEENSCKNKQFPTKSVPWGQDWRSSLQPRPG